MKKINNEGQILFEKGLFPRSVGLFFASREPKLAVTHCQPFSPFTFTMLLLHTPSKWRKRGQNTGYRPEERGASGNTTWSVGQLNVECLDFLCGVCVLSAREKVCKNGQKGAFLLSACGKRKLRNGKWKMENGKLSAEFQHDAKLRSRYGHLFAQE